MFDLLPVIFNLFLLKVNLFVLMLLNENLLQNLQQKEKVKKREERKEGEGPGEGERGVVCRRPAPAVATLLARGLSCLEQSAKKIIHSVEKNGLTSKDRNETLFRAQVPIR